MSKSATFKSQLEKLNTSATVGGQVQYLSTTPFGPSLELDTFELSNGLRLLLVEDHSAEVIAYHSWFRVGSRHERPGKTGISHLFEHLMFNETESLAKGEFDTRLEEVGAESNASTWLDFTQYNISAPSKELPLAIELEADRMTNLVLKEPQVESEKEVVANERRYRVDDDVEGATSELLWATAFEKHAYHWPTIGWMKDIESFTTEDCLTFYKTYYSPNNATVIIVGDFKPLEALQKVSAAYGHLASASLPLENVNPEPAQLTERFASLHQPTTTEKLALGYRAPALGDFDHVPLSLLCEILFGGRASRVYQRLITELELATELRMFVGPFHDPGLMELYASAREGHHASELLAVIDEEIDRVKADGVDQEEIERNRARFELGLLHSLDTAEGKAQTIGFYDCVLGEPAEAFRRLEALRRVTPSDLLRVARQYFRQEARTTLTVYPTSAPKTEVHA